MSKLVDIYKRQVTDKLTTSSVLVDIYKRQVTDKLTTSSVLVDIYKRQVTDRLKTSFHPSPRDKEATWTLLIQ